MTCNYTDSDAQRYLERSMSVDEEMAYIKHLAQCEVCQKRVEEYSIMSEIIFFDVKAPDVKKQVYKKVSQAKKITTLLMASVIIGMIIFGSHLAIQINATETNTILQALNNRNDNNGDSSQVAEIKVPAYMETSYSYGNW